MKITESTIQILRNFMRFNNNILLQPGKQFYSREADGSVIGIASVPEEFPEEMAIMDLQSLLSYFKLVKDPELSVEENKLIIKDDETSISYTLSDKELIVVQEKRPAVPDEPPFVTLKFTEDILSTIQTSKNIGVVKADTIKFYGDGNGKVFVSVSKADRPDSNSVTREIEVVGDAGVGLEFELSFKTDQFVMMDRDYNVELYEYASKNAFFATFVSEDVDYMLPCKANAGNMIVR